jgi:hypothetical protein
MGLLRVLYSWLEIGLGSTGNRTSGLHCTDPPMMGSSLSLSRRSLSVSRSLSLSLSASHSLYRISLSVGSLPQSPSLSLKLSISLSSHLSVFVLSSLSLFVSGERTR